MPNSWIGNIKLTSETEVLGSDGTKIHDYISCAQGAGVEVDEGLYPVLWGKLPASNPILTKDSSLASVWGTAVCVACSGDGAVVIVVNATSEVFRSEDAGVTFTATGASFYGDSYTEAIACSASGSIIYVAPYNGSSYELQKSTDGGLSFSVVPAVSVSIRSLCCTTDGATVFMGDSTTGNLYKSVDGGGSFTVVSNVPTISSANALACSSDGGTVYSTNSVNSYRQKSIDGGVAFSELVGEHAQDFGLACSGSGLTVLAVQNGSVTWSGDGGATAFEVLGTIHNTIPNRCCMSANGLRGYVVSVSGANRDFGTVALNVYVPDMPTKTGAPNPYKIVADRT